MKSQRGEVAANGERQGADLIGAWELASETDQGPRTSRLTVFGDLTGRYGMFGGEIPIKEIKVDGQQVAFAVEMGFGNQTFNLEFKGKLDGKTLKGEVTTPRGNREVTGKKVEEESGQAGPSPLVGAWEFTREGRQGNTVKTTLTIKPDMTGSYTFRDNTAHHRPEGGRRPGVVQGDGEVRRARGLHGVQGEGAGDGAQGRVATPGAAGRPPARRSPPPP